LASFTIGLTMVWF